jgi:hypothetical protein
MTHLSNTLSRNCIAIVLLLEICVISAFSADPGDSLNFAEAPLAGVWSAAGPMEYERYWFTATTLLNGRVLVTGGYSYEFYDLRDGRAF